MAVKTVKFADIHRIASEADLHDPKTHNHDTRYFTQSQVIAKLAEKADSDDLASVATSGQYSDLAGKPTIPTITDATVGAKGVIQLAGALGGTAASPTTPTSVHLAGSETITGVKTFSTSPIVPTPSTSTAAATKDYVDARQFKSSVTIGATAADFITTGTNDGAVLAAAFAALPASGGRIVIKNGTYNLDSTTAANRLTVSKSNVIVEGESYGGVILKATASLFSGGSDAIGQFGIVTIGRSQSTKISNIILRNLVIDCNNQLKTAGLAIDGGATSLYGSIGLQNVLVEHVTVKNSCQNDSDPVTAGTFVSSGRNTAIGNRGFVDGLTIRNCDFGSSARRGVYLQGGNITNLKILDCSIHDCGRDGLYYFNYDGTYTSDKWTIHRCRFENNMSIVSGSSQAHFRDSTQNGISNLTIDECYFGPAVNANTSQDYCLTPYWAENLRITRNFFDRTGSGVSIGASISGNYNKSFPITRMLFEGNTFYQSRSCFDPDSAIFGMFKDNIFYEVKQNEIFGSYSRHFPTIYEGNIIYNCHADMTGSESAYHLAAIQTAGDGFVIRNNYIIDDRKLADPTSGLSLSQSAAGTLPSRTYYVKFSWQNDTGETLGSNETTRAVSANNVLTTTYTPSYVPSGAKKLNVYVGTTSGAQTLQASIALPNKSLSWTEPITGLIAGAALPVANTTVTKTKHGIYELGGGAGGAYGNVYSDNHFIGIDTPITEHASYRRVRADNTWDYNGSISPLELPVYATDLELTDATKGVILKSPDGTRYRITVGNSGTLSATSV